MMLASCRHQQTEQEAHTHLGTPSLLSQSLTRPDPHFLLRSCLCRAVVFCPPRHFPFFLLTFHCLLFCSFPILTNRWERVRGLQVQREEPEKRRVEGGRGPPTPGRHWLVFRELRKGHHRTCVQDQFVEDRWGPKKLQVCYSERFQSCQRRMREQKRGFSTLRGGHPPCGDTGCSWTVGRESEGRAGDVHLGTGECWHEGESCTWVKPSRGDLVLGDHCSWWPWEAPGRGC